MKFVKVVKIFENFDKIVKRKFHKKDQFCKNFEILTFLQYLIHFITI